MTTFINTLRNLIAGKQLFDRTYSTYQSRYNQCWQYKYRDYITRKINRTDSVAIVTERAAIDAYSSFLLSDGLESIVLSHAEDPAASDKFYALAKKYDLLKVLHLVLSNIINYDSSLVHFSFSKDKFIARSVAPNQYIFAVIDHKMVPVVYDNHVCYYPLQTQSDDLSKDIKVINHKDGYDVGIIEKENAFSYHSTSRYTNGMMGCRAFIAMGIDDEMIEYKTALDTLMSLNSFPTLLMDNNALIKLDTMKPGQIVEYTPNINVPSLPPLRRAIPDSLNLAKENIQYMEYLKKQLYDVYMLDVILRDDTSGATTAVASLTSSIYFALTDVIEKFLKIMVDFGEFRDFNKEANINTLKVRYHSRATQGSNMAKYTNMVHTLETLMKLSQVNEEVGKSMDLGLIIKGVTEALGTADYVAFNKK